MRRNQTTKKQLLLINSFKEMPTSSSSPVVTTILSGKGTMGSKCGSYSSSAPPSTSSLAVRVFDSSFDGLFDVVLNNCCPAPSHLKSAFPVNND